VSSFGPQRGAFAHLEWVAIEAIVNDSNGVGDLKELHIMVGESQTDQSACIAKYDFNTRTLAQWVRESAIFSSDTIANGEWKFTSNSRCGVGYPDVVASSETEVAAWLGFAFAPVLTRPQEIYTMAVDKSGASTGWVRQGSFTFNTGCRVIPRPFKVRPLASGGMFGLTMWGTSDPCPWTLTASAPWISVATPSGEGSDIALFMVEPNPGTSTRRGTLTVGDQVVEVLQEAPGTRHPENFEISPAETIISSGSGETTIHVRAFGDEEWDVVSGVNWLSVIDRGRDYVTFAHDANSSTAERRATITVAGHTVVVRQLAGDPLRPAIAENGVVNGASFLPGISSGGWFTIRGVNLANTTRNWTEADFNGDRLPTSLDGVKVTVNGKSAYVSYISPTQINALAPEDTPIGLVPVEVENNGRRSLFDVAIRRTRSPGLFMLPAPVARMAAATLLDGTLVAPADTINGVATRGARPGDVISLYATGLGATNPAYTEGRLIAVPLATPLPVVTIGGRSAKVSYSGLTGPGLYQINVEVPELAAGEHDIVLNAEGTRTLQRAVLYIAP
jgi:uncharacterized protein (TIGR03437 family)